jgi:hypothetical protein
LAVDEFDGDFLRQPQWSFRLARVVSNQNDRFGVWFSRQITLIVLPVRTATVAWASGMISGNNTLAIQKHLETAYFVFA